MLRSLMGKKKKEEVKPECPQKQEQPEKLINPKEPKETKK